VEITFISPEAAQAVAQAVNDIMSQNQVLLTNYIQSTMLYIAGCVIGIGTAIGILRGVKGD